MLSILRNLSESSKSIEQTKKELEAQAEAAKTEIKDIMVANRLEEMEIDVFTVRYKPVLTSRFNSTELKKVNPDLYAKYLVESQSMKFTIS